MKHTPLACCPFCGETPSEIVDATKILGVYRIVHRCKTIPPFSIEAATPEKVAAAWNRRAPDPVREKLVEALEKSQSALLMLVEDSDPPSLHYPADVDPNDFANAFDEATSAIRSALLLAKGEQS
ncbi:hypothetical protein [Aquamicrobium sp. LC103]|uniref:hypothetical protein n=1 Tax=Aquamicrobium sp. LC103 TaxID=1120658 RepID=UPI00109CA040|nr:hypothetical protein [Aquamicrobium sp. LC103]